MSNPLFEPRGCPTPGACSAAHILERQREVLTLAEEALAIRSSEGGALEELDRRLSELANKFSGGDGTYTYLLHGLWRARDEIKAMRSEPQSVQGEKK